MPTHKLNNYLRAYRKRAGLTQREVAFLLGLRVRGPVSELEKRRRIPLLRTAFMLELIFGVPAGALFAGMRETLGKEVDARLMELAHQLSTKVDRKSHSYRTARKQKWLRERLRCNGVLCDESQPQAGTRA